MLPVDPQNPFWMRPDEPVPAVTWLVVTLLLSAIFVATIVCAVTWLGWRA